MVTVRLQLFGGLRRHSDGRSLEMVFDKPLSLAEFKVALRQRLNDALVDDSAFASGNEILSEEAWLGQSCTLSILPPVCGG